MTLQPTLHTMNKASSRRSTLLLSVNNFHRLWLPHAEQYTALKKDWRLVFKLVGEELDTRHHFSKEPVILWKVYSEAQETQPWPQRFLSCHSRTLSEINGVFPLHSFRLQEILGQVLLYAWLSPGAKRLVCARDPAVTPADRALICRPWLVGVKWNRAAGFAVCCSALLQLNLRRKNEWTECSIY